MDTLCYEVGDICLDEHTWVPALICDQTDLGVRLALLDTDPVPDVFLLREPASGTARLCKTIWRTHEVIGAWFEGTEVELAPLRC